MNNLDQWCNEIARRWITTPDASAQFEFLGVDPNQWPESKAKAILCGYLQALKKHNKFIANADFLDRASSLPSFEIPEDGAVFRVRYEKLLKYSRFSDLGKKLSTNPNAGEEILSQFLSSKKTTVEIVNFADKIQSIAEANAEGMKNKTNLVCLKGWEKLSNGVGGFGTDRVSMVVSGTGVGKTTLAINLARAAQQSGMPVLFFNMEMSIQDIGSRIIESETGTNHHDWLECRVKIELFNKMKEDWKNGEEFLLTTGKALTLSQISSAIIATATPNKKRFIVVDYDQKIISESSDDEWKTLHRAVEELEQVAKHTSSHIMILAQGNDDGDPKASKRMKQVAATVLHFSRSEQNGFQIRAIKNRFGEHNFTIGVRYNPEKAYAGEGEIIRHLDFPPPLPKYKKETIGY